MFTFVIIQYVISVWSFISLPFYISITLMLFLLRNKEPFNKPFFWLCISLAVIDILEFLHVYFLLIFKYLGHFSYAGMYTHPNPTVAWLWKSTMGMGGWFVGWAQYTAMLWIAVNRYTNIAHPTKLFWTPGRVKLALVSPWIVAVLVVGSSFTREFPLLVFNGTRDGVELFEIYEAYPDNKYYALYLKCVATLLTVLVLIQALLYFLTFLSLRQHNNQMAETEDNTMRKAEARLVVMGFLLWCFLSAQDVCTVAVSFNMTSPEWRLLFSIVWVQFIAINCMVNPWFLVICSKQTRQQFVKFVKGDLSTGQSKKQSRTSVKVAPAGQKT